MLFRITRYILSCTLIWAFSACKKDVALAPPGGLAITNITDSGATINWDPVGKATGYTLYIASDTSFNYNYLVPGYGPATVPQSPVIVTNLTPGTKYFVKVVRRLRRLVASYGRQYLWQPGRARRQRICRQLRCLCVFLCARRHFQLEMGASVFRRHL